ncbi:hypothetical protein IMSAG013_01138 [Clostridiales bacterium]|nr:hypothetical protein IMSAG013_01138 [Clostridiales bacterium]
MDIQKILELHKKWLNKDSDGKYANLRCADVDYSCLPLWCGSLHMKVDKRIAAQIAYHFCALECDDPDVQKTQQSLYALANTFHRVGELLRLGE